jgi:hypothetical protein
MSDFITDCINGDALISEVDDYVDRWHENGGGISLHEYLGMTKSEYALFVEDEDYLGLIISARVNNTTIENIVNEELAMAARSDDPAKSRKLEQWLTKKKLWD